MDSHNKPIEPISLHHDLLLSVHKDVAVISQNLSEVRTDLKEHMRRTAILEAKFSSHDRVIWMGAGALTLLSVAATFLGILRYLRP